MIVLVNPLLLAVALVFPRDGSEVPLLPACQKRVMEKDTLSERVRALAAERDCDGPVWRESAPLTLKWRAEADERGPWAIEIARNPDFSDARVWAKEAGRIDPATGREIPQEGLMDGEYSFVVPQANLEVATRYYWRVTGNLQCGVYDHARNCRCEKARPVRTSAVGTFVTEDLAPRWIALEGRIRNVRDLGGRIGRDGRRIRQGLVYRGQGLNDNSVDGVLRGRSRLTVEDVTYLKETLGIRTDLDLRNRRETANMSVSPLGPDITFISRPSHSYGHIFSPDGKKVMAANFRVFCDRRNYPVYFHCIGGADRTGALAYVMNGVLGVSRREIEGDWESTFYPDVPGADEGPDSTERAWNSEWHFNLGFARYGTAEDSWNRRIELYLLDCGITAEEIETFRSIMLEPKRGFAPCTVRGRTEPGAWIVSNCGQIVRADEKGRYEIVLPVQGIYCLKAMKDGFDEVVRPWLEVPSRSDVDLPLWARPNPKSRVVHGDLGHPAQLVVTDGGAPVRGFDLAGTAVGSYPAPKGVWHEANRYFWTSGEYCFTATGEVRIVEVTHHPELKRRGWLKGDFHAHIVHGENFYHANLQQMDFICRAERYDWIYLSGDHANDQYPVDHWELSKYLSDDRLFLRVNNEFPKNIAGHFGNLNVPPLTTKDYGDGYGVWRVTDLELAERTVYARGGLCVPVHPIYGDVVRTDGKTGRRMYGMINNELMLWLLCRPDLVPVVDFFYFPEERAERFWYRLLNRGYTLACSGTSDAAFDVGKSPHSSHATYAKLGPVDGPSIVEAFRKGRTMVGYHGCGIVFEIDGRTCGDVLAPDGSERTLVADAYAVPGQEVVLKVVRNGETFAERRVTVPADGRVTIRKTFAERETAWYVAILKDAKGGDWSILSAASPIYFRDGRFRPPETYSLPVPLPERIRERIKYLTPAEVDTDEWYDELRRMLEEERK